MTAVVTIFGGSRFREGDKEYELACELGGKLAKAGYTVCNGGYGGVMEASARGAKEAGGKTVGVTTGEFGGPANLWIHEEIRMKKWVKRLFKLIELGDAYVVLDGGTGTLVELFVVWEMLNKKLIHPTCGFYGFFEITHEGIERTEGVPILFCYHRGGFLFETKCTQRFISFVDGMDWIGEKLCSIHTAYPN